MLNSAKSYHQKQDLGVKNNAVQTGHFIKLVISTDYIAVILILLLLLLLSLFACFVLPYHGDIILGYT